MVCVQEEGKISFTVQNASTDLQNAARAVKVDVAPGMTVQEVMRDVGRKFHYEPDSFEIVLQNHEHPEVSGINLSEHLDETVEAVEFDLQHPERSKLVLTNLGVKQGSVEKPPRKVTGTSEGSEDDMHLGASASPDYMSTSTHPPAAITSGSGGIGFSSCSNSFMRHDTGFVGLVNQAMTCYLNSLLQALYMTPEFRNALYKWEFDGSEQEESKSIPYQLQKLFLNLQTSTKSAVETTELTRSFGWDSSEAWQQHDIQELCRVMFDALEHKFKNTKQSDLILRLYEGKMTDYVKCLLCGTEKTREDTFLDIPLPVRPFGSSVAYGSVEEALRAFVQPETLDGNNQYFCEKCNKKCDAHKGLKFSKFPYLLTLHLKRFDFDYATLHRIKLNDKVVFPDILDLNSFVAVPDSAREENDAMLDDSIVKNDDSSTTDSGSALDDESCQGTEMTTSTQETDYQDDDEGIDMTNGRNLHENEKNRRHTLERGPYLYELFSIMIHSGSATGGHYYAYIKDFSSREWFCFNDQSVTRITYDDIKKTYGGGPMRGYYSGAYSSSTNAYMLMYRQIDKERNCEAMTVEEFPPHIKVLLEKIQEREEMDKKIREKEMDMCRLRVYVHHPVHKLQDTKLYCPNNMTLTDATRSAWEAFALENVVPLERCRLVNYDHLQDAIECSFEGRGNEPINDVVTSMRSNYMLLEIRAEDKEFEVYQPGGVVAKVFVVDIETEEVDGPFSVRGNLSQTVGEFKQTLLKSLSLNWDAMNIVLEKHSGARLLQKDHKTLKFEGFYGKSNKIFISSRIDEDSEKSFYVSKLHSLIDRFEHIITLHLVLPDIDKDTLEKLSIPLLSLDVNHNSSGDAPLRACDACEGEEAMIVDSSQSPCHPARDSSPQLPGDVDDEGIGATGHSDQSASEDSSLTDSDRTLVGDAPDECLAQLSSPSNSPPTSDQHVSSPEDGNTNSYHSFAKNEVPLPEPTENWDNDAANPVATTTKSPCSYYFRAHQYCDNDSRRMLKVLVDKRSWMGLLKKNVERHVGVPQEYFKVFRVYTSQQEFECSRLNEQLSSFHDDEQLLVRLGRALRKGEHRGKVYQLLPNEQEPIKFLCDWVLGKGMTVADVKRELLEELQKYSIDIPFERCRLRKKSWKNPAKVYLDDQRFDDDITLFPNWELFLQELPGPEPVTSSTQLVLFVRRWSPAAFRLEPFQEVLLDSSLVEEFKAKLSELSGIPADNIEITKPQGSFPCEMSLLGIPQLEWNNQTTMLDSWPYNIYEDGNVFFYRDNREKPKQLSNDERKEIANKEGLRSKFNTKTSTYSPRKERALKIYVDSSPKKVEDFDLD
ncbi:ubiquitin carboxyl-terminal hydrolase 47 isoform X2 [Bacillus rossius redtenbacheri]